MPETDRQTDKTTRWAMTVYEQQWPLLEKMPEIIAEWGWQDEKCPDTGRVHRQGYFRTHRQVRFSQAKQALPGVHIEVARDWNKLLNYCKKADTSLGNQVHQVSTNVPMTMAESLIALAKYHWVDKMVTQKLEQFIYKDHQEAYKAEYWVCVNAYLASANKDNSIGLFTNNQMLLAWTKTRRHWIKRYEEQSEHVEISADSDSDAISESNKP